MPLLSGQDWLSIASEPSELVCWGISALFSLTAGAMKRQKSKPWAVRTMIGVAGLSIVAGIGLLLWKVEKSPRLPTQQVNGVIQQQTSGPGSPNVQGVQGDVTIEVDQSGVTKEKKSKTKNKPSPSATSK